MRKFHCTKCGNRVHFDNSICLGCGSHLGFDPLDLDLQAIEPTRDGIFRKVSRGMGPVEMRYCGNAQHGVCNWLIPAEANTAMCRACSLNRLIPDLSWWSNIEAWRDLEKAKRRLVYSLLRFRLPTDGGRSGIGPLTFDFVAGGQMGHLNGVITIDISEANAVERERQRTHFDEVYRSLLGHLRHESGHYYWMLLVEAAGHIEEFRTIFGDERADYGQSLADYHSNGPRSDWATSFVSRYASAHPWEDWAETWAHYLHMVAVVDTAEALDMVPRDMEPRNMQPRLIEPRSAWTRLTAIWTRDRRDVHLDEPFERLMQRWLPLSVALNSLNRSMGHQDFYPFVIPQPAVSKLAFVHRMIRNRGN